MHRRLLLLLVATLLLLPATAHADTQGVDQFEVSPDPVTRPSSGTTTLTVSVTARINPGVDNNTSFCVYGPQTGYTYPANITLTYTQGFATVPILFAGQGVSATCPTDFGTGRLYTANTVNLGTGTYSGSFEVTLGSNAAIRTNTWTFLLEEPQDGPNPRNDNHTVAAPLAVNLASFSVTATPDGARVEWETVSEVNNAGFNVYRSDRVDALGERVNEALIASQAPGSSQGHAYQLLDTATAAGSSYYYWLESVDAEGNTELSGPATLDATPTAVTLGALQSAPTGTGQGALPVALLGLAGAAWAWRRRR